MVISRAVEFDYGHTLPRHYGFCQNIHGHRGKLIASFSGEVIKDVNSSENGMVIDFSICKKIMNECVVDKIDHAFAIWDNLGVDIVNLTPYPDKGEDVNVSTLEFIKMRNNKVLLLDAPPTAEVLATWAFNEIFARLKMLNKDIQLVEVQWYETPNNVAIITK